MKTVQIALAFEPRRRRQHLPETRRLQFVGQHAAAEALVTREFLGERPLASYQPVGEVALEFPKHDSLTPPRLNTIRGRWQNRSTVNQRHD